MAMAMAMFRLHVFDIGAGAAAAGIMAAVNVVFHMRIYLFP